MNFLVRPARADDYQAIYRMAKLTGGGFTNLPPDRVTLINKLARSADSFAREEDEQDRRDDLPEEFHGPRSIGAPGAVSAAGLRTG